MHALDEAGGLDALFVEPNDSDELGANNGAQSLTIATNQGDQVPVEARLFTSPWEGESALVLMLTGVGSSRRRRPAKDLRDRAAPRQGGGQRGPRHPRCRGRRRRGARPATLSVHSINGGAEKLFGYTSRELTGLPFASLFAPESQRDVLESLNGASEPGAA